MDGLAIEVGRTACDAFSAVAFIVSRARCADLGAIRGMGYGLFGVLVFAASYLAMMRRAPI
jgi:hypothetical protein